MLNRIQLLGYLGADPDLRSTTSGKSVLNFRLATEERYKDRDNKWTTHTEWHSVVVWGQRGDALAQILRKGSLVYVEGPVRTSSYEDRDGVKRWKCSVNATEVKLCDRKPNATQGGQGSPSSGRSAPGDAAQDPDDFGRSFGEDDIPF